MGVDVARPQLLGEQHRQRSLGTARAEVDHHRNVLRMLRREPEYSFSTAANDTGLLNVRGIETVNYGSRAVRFQHTDNDLVSINSVVEAAKVYMFMALVASAKSSV